MRCKRNYNIPFIQGYSDSLDQDFVGSFGLPQKLVCQPEMNLWMTYHIYLENIEAHSDDKAKQMLYEQFDIMRDVIPRDIWTDMYVNDKVVNEYESRMKAWWMFDDGLFSACKTIYKEFKE